MKNLKWIIVVVAMLPLAACDLLSVNSPGRLADDDLNAVSAFPGLVTGMSFRLSRSIDGTFEEFAMASGEIWHGGSYNYADVPRGIITAEDVDADWRTLQQARWVAEDGLRRMGEVLDPTDYGRSPFVAQALFYAGITNRNLGENLCSTAIDGGAEEPYTVHFQRAMDHFNQAISVGEIAGLTNFVTAAYGGRASIKAWTGDWAGAVSDAEQVPDDFVFVADFTSEQGNDFYFETHNRFEFSVWGTEYEAHPNDPRAPWEIVRNADGSIANGANGATPHYQQKKYTSLEADVPIVKGTEMLLLRAEAALELSQDVGAAVALMNRARAEYGMSDLDPEPATLAEAWETLHFERGATNWLEGRRLWDRRRWFAKGASSPGYDPFLEGRDGCWPISDEERRANSNLSAP